jgi:hypothetical protein
VRGRNLPRPGQKPSVATAEISGQAALMHIGLPLPRGLGGFLTLGRVDLGRLGRVNFGMLCFRFRYG